jgi:hypothetical protein
MGFHFTLTAEPEVDIRLNSEGSSPNETSPPKTPSDVGSRAHSMPIPLTGLYALLPDPEKARCRSRSNSLTSGLIKQSSSGLFSTGSEADVTATNKDLVSNEVLNATSDKGVDEAVEVFPSGIVSPVANSVLSSGIPQLIFAAETAIDRTEPKDYLVTSDQLRSFDVYDINIGPVGIPFWLGFYVLLTNTLTDNCFPSRRHSYGSRRLRHAEWEYCERDT